MGLLNCAYPDSHPGVGQLQVFNAGGEAGPGDDSTKCKHNAGALVGSDVWRNK